MNSKSLLMVSTVPVTLYGFLLPIVRRMRDLGWRVDGAASGITESGACVEAFNDVWEIDWSRNPLDTSNLSSAVKRIRSIVEDGGYDIVHVHTPIAAFVTRMALRSARAHGACRIVYTAHGFHFHETNGAVKNAAFLTLEKLAGRWTDRLVLINERDVGEAVRHHIVPAEKVVYMHGIGIDTSRYSATSVPVHKARAARAEIGVGSGETLFLMPAEFIPRKRHDMVVKALELAGRDDLHVAFIGIGPTLEQVQAQVRAAGLDRTVHFLGWRTDVPELMAAADAVMLISRQEGLSRAVMEALAMEKPVIGSDIRGIRELLCDGCGRIIPPERHDMLAQAMVQMASEPDLALEMGRKGRAKMTGPYEEKSIVAAHEELYAHV